MHRWGISALVIILLGVFSLSGPENRAHANARRPHRVTVRLNRLWTRALQPVVDSNPAYLATVSVGGHGAESVVYVLAGNNAGNCDPGNPVKHAVLYALDARSGKTLWTRSTSGPSRCTTAGPVVDPSGAYVYAPGLDGKIHRYSAAGGKESFTQGWPEPVTLMPDVEKMSATPTIANHRLYVTTSGFIGDQGHYEGHVVAIDLRGGKPPHVFNSLCSNIRHLLDRAPGSGAHCAAVQSGLFGRGEGAVDPISHDVYIVSGNGPWNGHTNWGDSILKLDPTGEKLLDSFTPTNQAALASADADLGSSGSAVLPAVRFAGHTYHLLVQAGKGPACDSCNGVALRLLNRDDLSGRRGPGHLGGDLYDAPTPGGGEVLTAPATWRSPTGEAWDVVATGSAVAGYKVVRDHGRFRLQRVWLDQPGGSTPVIRHGVLYLVSSGQVRAIDPSSGAVLGRASGIGDIHWQYPLIAGRTLFVTDQSGRMFAFGIR